MKDIFICCFTALLLVGCGTRRDVQYFESKERSLKISGSLDRKNLLIVKINDMKVIEEKVPLSMENMYAEIEGLFEDKRLSALCTISASNIKITFCDISLDSKDIASLSFER
jgi:hypothetical protein